MKGFGKIRRSKGWAGSSPRSGDARTNHQALDCPQQVERWLVGATTNLNEASKKVKLTSHPSVLPFACNLTEETA